MKYDLAIFESFSWNPHLGATYDIAITAKKEGKSVIVFLICNNNLEENRNFNIKYEDITRRKFIGFKKLLISHKIECIILDKGVLNSAEISTSEEFANQNLMIDSGSLKTLSYQNINLGIGVYSSLVSITNELDPEPANHQNIIKQLLSNSVIVYAIAKYILGLYSFNKVISFNGRFGSCIGIFEACKLFGISYAFHERGCRFNKYQIFEKKPHDIEYIRSRMLDYFHEQKDAEFKRKIVRDFFNDRLNGNDTGWISFSRNFSQQLNFNSQVEKKLIVYFSSSDFEFSAFEDLAPHTVFKNQKDAVVSLCNYIKVHPEFHLIIRTHPNLINAKKEAEFLQRLAHDNIQVIPPDSKVSSYDILSKGDIIVGYGSTILAEAVYQGKVVITLFNAEYCLKGFPVCYQPSSEQEMLELLKTHEQLVPFKKENIEPWAYWMGSQGIQHKYYKPLNLFEGQFWFSDFFGINRLFDLEWSKEFNINMSISIIVYYRKIRSFIYFSKKSFFNLLHFDLNRKTNY